MSGKALNKNSPIVFRMTTYTAIVQKEEDMYVAKCPEIGTASQGKSIEEAVANLKEATELYLQEFPATKSIPPILTTFEVGETA
jgi:predicted RNase H-like HicB family nuclease